MTPPLRSHDHKAIEKRLTTIETTLAYQHVGSRANLDQLRETIAVAFRAHTGELLALLSRVKDLETQPSTQFTASQVAQDDYVKARFIKVAQSYLSLAAQMRDHLATPH